MKKLFIAALALATVACTKSEVLETAPQKAISFGNPFVENATKAIDPSLTHGTEGTFTSFNVYGTLSNGTATTNIFNGVEVVKVSYATHTIGATGTWYYNSSSVQYWIPGNTYNFVAVANATKVNVDAANNNMPTTLEYTADGKTDLLYTKTPVTKTPDVASFDETVAFTFDHLLSKVKFTFINGYPADSKLVVEVSDVKIINAYTSGVCTLTGEEAPTWGSFGTADKKIEFGNIVQNGTDYSEAVYSMPATGALSGTDWTTKDGFSSNYERLLIPGQSEFNVTFTAEVLLNGIVVNSYSGSTVTVQGGLQPGYSYNFVGTIGQNLEKITFSVEKINGFTPVTPEDE